MGRVKELILSDNLLKIAECLFCSELKGFYLRYVEHFLIYHELSNDFIPPYDLA